MIRHRSLAIGTIVVLSSIITVGIVAATSYATLQTINPTAAVSAVIVAVVGMVWFKKSSH